MVERDGRFADPTSVSCYSLCLFQKPAAQSQLVWVKVRGYPWWPAMVVSMSDVPESQRECVESGRKGTEQQLVFSFGEQIFFWVNPSRATLRPFQDPESYNGGNPVPSCLSTPAIRPLQDKVRLRREEPRLLSCISDRIVNLSVFLSRNLFFSFLPFSLLSSLLLHPVPHFAHVDFQFQNSRARSRPLSSNRRFKNVGLKRMLQDLRHASSLSLLL